MFENGLCVIVFTHTPTLISTTRIFTPAENSDAENSDGDNSYADNSDAHMATRTIPRGNFREPLFRLRVMDPLYLAKTHDKYGGIPRGKATLTSKQT